jgi:hypothetical protein
LSLVALWCAPVLAGQDTTTPLSPDSNGGGNPFTLTCGIYTVRTHVLIGIQGGSGTWVDWVQGICSEVSNDGRWAGTETTTGRSQAATGTSYALRCPRNHAVSAVSGYAGGWLDRLTVYCRPIGTGGVLAGSTVRAGETSGSTNQRAFGPNECPGNEPAVGLIGNAGKIPLGPSVVERIGLTCAVPMISKLKDLTLSGISVVAPNKIRATLSFSFVTPSGTSVALTSFATPIATVPSSVSIPAGTSTRTFDIASVAGPGGCVDILAKHAGLQQSVRLAVHPPVSAVAKVTLSSPDQAAAPGSQQTLRVVTPGVTSGLVTLSSSNSAIATVPASVTTSRVRNVDLSGSASVTLNATGTGCAIITAAFQGTTSRRTILVTTR